MASERVIHWRAPRAFFARCHKSRSLAFVSCAVLLAVAGTSGLLVHTYGRRHIVWTKDSTLHHANMRLHASKVTEAPCNTTCRWLREQHTRKQRVSTTCNSYRNSSMGQDLSFTLTPELLQKMNHFLVLDSHKLIYCYIPKAGCTNWKRVFLMLEGVIKNTTSISQFDTHVRAANRIRTLPTYSLQEATERIANYTKFMFVRHPFERILSGYRDKFLMDYPASTIFRRKYGRQISTYGGPKHLAVRPDGTLNVTFGQFVRYVGDPANTFRGNDATEHWNEMHRMCHPCMMNYDFFGNFSTLHEDADFLLHTNSLDSAVSYPKSTNPTNSSDGAYMSGYFSDLSPMDIKALVTRYAIDFKLFGYTVPTSVQTILDNVRTE